MAGNNSFPTPSGTISMSDLNSALGQSSTTSISFNDSRVRFLANQDSGSVSMSNMRNKFYSDGSTGVITYYDDGKGTVLRYGTTSPRVFGASAYSQLTYDINNAQNYLVAGYWGSNIGLGSRTFRVQISNGVTTSNFNYVSMYNDGSNGWLFELYSPAGATPFFSAANQGNTYTFKVASL